MNIIRRRRRIFYRNAIVANKFFIISVFVFLQNSLNRSGFVFYKSVKIVGLTFPFRIVDNIAVRIVHDGSFNARAVSKENYIEFLVFGEAVSYCLIRIKVFVNLIGNVVRKSKHRTGNCVSVMLIGLTAGIAGTMRNVVIA